VKAGNDQLGRELVAGIATATKCLEIIKRATLE
jgi:hypothetical protein